MDDAAATSIAFGSTPFHGAFKPEDPLSAFNGEAIKGDWKLIVEDGWQGESGKLQDWAVYITP